MGLLDRVMCHHSSFVMMRSNADPNDSIFIHSLTIFSITKLTTSKTTFGAIVRVRISLARGREYVNTVLRDAVPKSFLQTAECLAGWFCWRELMIAIERRRREREENREEKVGSHIAGTPVKSLR